MPLFQWSRPLCWKIATEENKADPGGHVVRDGKENAEQKAHGGRDTHTWESQEGWTTQEFFLAPFFFVFFFLQLMFFFLPPLSSQFNATSTMSTPTSLLCSGLGGTLCQSSIQKPPLSASKVCLSSLFPPSQNQRSIPSEDYFMYTDTMN